MGFEMQSNKKYFVFQSKWVNKFNSARFFRNVQQVSIPPMAEQGGSNNDINSNEAICYSSATPAVLHHVLV